ncbi:pyridoxamine 5'-phosphate oxidase-domain-containing protein [Aspergillus ambiguus]|uniref:uncharacterized protein n=1 Tax=Aspergillus ambiguus TaxID=176160 RepID=UPI003CCD327B
MTTQAPWRELFESHLTQNSTTSFTITTVDYDEQNRPVPRARTCEFRGFWPNPALHPSALDALNAQCGGPNPSVYESDMLSLTTDVRMAKAGQLEASGHVVEGVFWLKDVMNQWRVRGLAYVVGDPAGGAREEEARREVLRRMRRASSTDADAWTWERQVTSYFANHSPAMRGSFRNPPPGCPRSETPADPNLRIGQKVEDLHDPVARGNFRVVVVRPVQVERLDLSDLQDVRRMQWTFVEGDDNGHGCWEKVELWP